MDSSSSSSDRVWSLAIKAGAEAWHYVPLRENLPAPGALAIETSLCVNDRDKYAFALATSKPYGQKLQASILINGEERARTHIAQPVQQGSLYLYGLSFSDPGRATFGLTFGFVTITVRLGLADEKATELSTKEIPCSCSWPEQRAAVTNMLTELSGIDCHPSISWMLGGERGGVRASALREGGGTNDRSRSLRAFIALAERSLASLEKNLPFFRLRPLSRTLPIEKKVPAVRVQRVGRAESIWMALNPECLVEVADGLGFEVRGKRYVPTSVRTSLPKRSLDNMENRAVLQFVSHIVFSLIEVSRVLDEEIVRMRGVRSILGGLPDVDGLLPSLVVADVCLELEEPLVERIVALGKCAKRTLRLYGDALGTPVEGRFRVPRRSKAFQEIPHYAAVWSLMAEWDTFGEYPLNRELLLLGTYKMDRLYEYYALFGLLRWMQDAGFSPDPTIGEAALESVQYSLKDRFFRNEMQVTNKYVLRRGGERLTLYYQPVVYGEDRSEGGVDLRRITAKNWFDPRSGDSYWTPDFLLYFEKGNVSRCYVLDAKFSSIKGANKAFMDGNEDADGLSMFEKCLAKYRYGILRENGDQIDGLWLMCGRAVSAVAMPVCGSSWFNKSGFKTSDGLVALAPGANALDELFLNLGVSSSVSMVTMSQIVALEPVASVGLRKQIRTAQKFEESSALRKARTSGVKESRSSRAIEPELLEEIGLVWDSLTEQQRKNSSRFSQQVLGVGHPFVRLQPPQGKEARFYTEKPVDVSGTLGYVFCDWKPTYRFRLRKAAQDARKNRSK